MLAPLIALLALAAQLPTAAAPDDGPLATAPRERPAVTEVPGLDDLTVATPAAPESVSPESLSPEPVSSEPTASVSPPAGDEAAPGADAEPARTIVEVEAKTRVDGGTLQVVLGQRALFRLDDQGAPVLIAVEDGRLAAAHPPGKAEETFGAPPAGQIAVALDGSAEVRATLLKIWNETDKAVDYRAIALVYTGGKVIAAEVPVCAVAPRSVRTETWRRPVVGVGLSRFTLSNTTRACR